MASLFAAAGALGILLFHQGIYLPIVVSAAVFVLVAWYLVRLYKKSQLGPLMVFLYLIYVLPFIHVFPYIWFNFEVENPAFLWGLAVNVYMTDETIIKLMSMIGAVGAVGFAAGAALGKGKLSMARPGESIGLRTNSTLSMPAALGWAIGAVMIAWISAPSETVFTVAYTESESTSDAWNFSAAWMLSNILLVFLLADAMFERSPLLAKRKRQVIFYATFIAVVWFQLFRGNRESLTLVLSFVLMNYAWGKGLIGAVVLKMKLNRAKVVAVTALVVLAGYFVGIMRHSLVGVSSITAFVGVFEQVLGGGSFRIDSLLSGTWSGALMTPLSVAGDYVNGWLEPKYGRTYLDLLLSIPPGFVTDWIGYIRPIDRFNGPAWEMTFGLGGTHAVVVPFMNFRMAGVFLIVAAWSFAFTRVERYSMNSLSVLNLAFLGTVALAAPHWLWYGEKMIMTAVIIWATLSVIYRIRVARRAATASSLSYGASRA